MPLTVVLLLSVALFSCLSGTFVDAQSIESGRYGASDSDALSGDGSKMEVVTAEFSGDQKDRDKKSQLGKESKDHQVQKAVKKNDDLWFLFVQLRHPNGVRQVRHRAHFYFLLDVSTTMEPSLKAMTTNLHRFVASLSNQTFSWQAKILLFTDACLESRFIHVPSSSSDGYGNFLQSTIKNHMPSGSGDEMKVRQQPGDVEAKRAWTCTEKSGYHHEELGLEAMKVTIKDIGKIRADSSVKTYPTIVMVSDEPHAYLDSQVGSPIRRASKDYYPGFASEFYQYLDGLVNKDFDFSSLRIFASLGESEENASRDSHLYQQYHTVIQSAMNRDMPEDQGNIDISFPLSGLAFHQILGSITSTVDSYAARKCYLTEARIQEENAAGDVIREEIFDVSSVTMDSGTLRWEDALSGFSSSHVKVTETRCCHEGSEDGSGNFSPSDLPDKKSCSFVYPSYNIEI